MGMYAARIVDPLNGLTFTRQARGKKRSSWKKTAEAVGLELDDEAAALIDAWPAELVDTIVGLVTSAASSGARLRWTWKPGYDFEVSIAKVNYDEQPEYTITLTSPYPKDVLRPGS